MNVNEMTAVEKQAELKRVTEDLASVLQMEPLEPALAAGDDAILITEGFDRPVFVFGEDLDFNLVVIMAAVAARKLWQISHEFPDNGADLLNFAIGFYLYIEDMDIVSLELYMNDKGYSSLLWNIILELYMVAIETNGKPKAAVNEWIKEVRNTNIPRI